MLEQTCSTTAVPSQNCQYENGPDAMAKVPAQFRSAAMRHSPSADAITAPGVSIPATATASRWFLIRLLTFGPRWNRILTTMAR